jgi:hypothetical protein
MDTRKKALEAVRSLADEALRTRFKSMRAPKVEPKAEPKAEPELSDEEQEQLAALYERETSSNGRA